MAEPPVQRVTDADLLAAQRQDDRDGALPRARDDVPQHVEALLVDPLQVVGDEHHGSLAGQPVDPVVELHGVDPHRPGVPARAHRGRRHAVRQVPQHAADGPER